jgi:hypothetical protein
LLPNLAQPKDSCQVMLQESQASVEKLVSRQKF